MNYKVAIIGAKGVGKSSLIKFYGLKNNVITFDSNYGEIKFTVGGFIDNGFVDRTIDGALHIYDSSEDFSTSRSYEYLLGGLRLIDGFKFDIKSVICANKCDLLKPGDLIRPPVISHTVKAIFRTSIVKEENNPFEILGRYLTGKDDLVLFRMIKLAVYGQSGVGRSALINNCNPQNGVISFNSDQGDVKLHVKTMSSFVNYNFDAVLVLYSTEKSNYLDVVVSNVKKIRELAPKAKIFVCHDNSDREALFNTLLNGDVKVSNIVLCDKCLVKNEWCDNIIPDIMKIISDKTNLTVNAYVPEPKKYKVVLVGDPKVGKTTYFNQLTNQLTFHTNYEPITFIIHDQPNDLTNVDVAVIMYDSEESFHRASDWKSKICYGNPNIKIIFVCTKADTRNKVWYKGSKPSYRISVKSNVRILDPFVNLAKQFLNNKGLLIETYDRNNTKVIQDKLDVVEALIRLQGAQSKLLEDNLSHKDTQIKGLEVKLGLRDAIVRLQEEQINILEVKVAQLPDLSTKILDIKDKLEKELADKDTIIKFQEMEITQLSDSNSWLSERIKDVQKIIDLEANKSKPFASKECQTDFPNDVVVKTTYDKNKLDVAEALSRLKDLQIKTLEDKLTKMSYELNSVQAQSYVKDAAIKLKDVKINALQDKVDPEADKPKPFESKVTEFDLPGNMTLRTTHDFFRKPQLSAIKGTRITFVYEEEGDKQKEIRSKKFIKYPFLNNYSQI